MPSPTPGERPTPHLRYPWLSNRAAIGVGATLFSKRLVFVIVSGVAVAETLAALVQDFRESTNFKTQSCFEKMLLIF